MRGRTVYYIIKVYDKTLTSDEPIEKIEGECLMDLLEEKLLAVVLCKIIQYGRWVDFNVRVNYCGIVTDGEWKELEAKDIVATRGLE